MNKEKIKEAIEELYNLNADISLHFVGLKEKPTLKIMGAINKRLGEIIKKLRKEVD